MISDEKVDFSFVVEMVDTEIVGSEIVVISEMCEMGNLEVRKPYCSFLVPSTNWVHNIGY